MVEQKVELAVPAVSAVAAPAAADTDTLEPLEIKLPAAAYVGTPVTVPAAGTAKIQERVPILGDVPLLGQKFRSERLAEVAKQAEAGEQLGKPVAEGARKGVAAVTSAGQLKFEVELQRTQTALRYGLVAKADQKESAAGKSREMLGREVREKEVAQVVEKLDSVASGVSALGPAAPAQQLAELDVEIRKAQTKTEELRAKYNISETTENFMSLSNEELARAPRLVAKPAEEIAKEKAEIDAKHYGGYFAANAELKKLQELRAGLAKSEERLSEVAVTGAAAAPLLEEEPKVVSRPVPVPQPEVPTSDNPFSTFSLNVSDVSFKLAASSLENGTLPDPAGIRSEEFINAFDYHDPEPMPGLPLAFAWERARTPFAHNRDLLRLSLQTAARGREPGRPLNLVLLLDNSGSMERADRVAIIREALRVLAGQLQPQDKISVVAFSRTPRLWIDGLPGAQAGELVEKVGNLTPQGGTNLEDALRLAYETAARHYLANGVNRVVLLTDGAANLGDVDPESLKQKVESNRKQGIALDCFGIGWEGYNDDLLEVLSRNGDGRYGFVNTPEEAAAGFANQLAGALQVAAADVKVQVEFNPQRVTAWRQIGYAKHQLTKEQFRDNTVDAAEIGAAETGNALYTMEVNPRGEGPLGMVRARFKVPATGEYREYEWELPYLGEAAALDQSSPSMRLAGAAAAFSEWLASSPFAAEVTPDELLKLMAGVPEVFGADARPKKLEWMIRQAKSLAGK
jgi:Mg-chelatase subunit ChlD